MGIGSLRMGNGSMNDGKQLQFSHPKKNNLFGTHRMKGHHVFVQKL